MKRLESVKKLGSYAACLKFPSMGLKPKYQCWKVFCSFSSSRRERKKLKKLGNNMAPTRDTLDWNLYLRQWSRDLLERLEDSEFTILPSESINARWLGYPEATDTEISTVEASLKTTLPSSYRSFLKVSNGWQKIDNMIGKLFSIQQVNWLASRNQELIDGWMNGVELGGGSSFVPDKEYFVYGDEQDSTSLRNEYLQTALEIGGDANQGLLLLNPQIISENGEWEAWFFANWLPGAERYKSFQELIQDRHRRLLEFPKLREIRNF